jgi:hypothetical protein
MSGALLRAAAIVLAAVLAQSCVVAPGEVGVEGVAPGYDADYYDAPAVYGGWGVGFDVAPYGRGDREHHPDFRGGDDRGGARGFRPAAAGRPVPTIPTGARGGGARGGGAPHGGGGGGGHGGGGRH